MRIRDDAHAPTFGPGRLRETVAALEQSTPALVVQLSIAGSVHDYARFKVLDADPDLCSLTMGTTKVGAMSSSTRGYCVRALPAG